MPRIDIRRITCPHCSKPAELVDGAAIYPGRDDLAAKKFWRCVPCGSHVGCHPGTNRPLGDLAQPMVRRARTAAQAAFDRLWKAKMRRDNVSKHEARGAAYKWLADKLEIKVENCHIGMMDAQTARRVALVCQPYLATKKRKAA